MLASLARALQRFTETSVWSLQAAGQGSRCGGARAQQQAKPIARAEAGDVGGAQGAHPGVEPQAQGRNRSLMQGLQQSTT